MSRDIHSLTEFKRNTSHFLEALREQGRAVVLTVNGKAELVAMSAESFQWLLDQMEQLEVRTGLRRGLEDVREGRVEPVEKVVREVRRRSRRTSRDSPSP